MDTKSVEALFFLLYEVKKWKRYHSVGKVVEVKKKRRLLSRL